MYSEILYRVEGPIARVTLNRPERRNPLGPTALGELVHAFAAAKADPAVRVIVITGAGKVFSAGGDLAAFAGRPGEAPAIPPSSFVELTLAMARLGKPTIAQVNGHALAGGCGLVCACDLVLASNEAQLGMPEINVGLWPMMISATIVRNVARKRVLELMLTGERISAVEAERIGLITHAVPPPELPHRTDELARTIAGKSPKVIALGLAAFYETQDLELEPALNTLRDRLMEVLATEDAREGLAAFLEKRPPVWKGR
jgi:enoyl-CoA hydratase/carnithine racemase